MKRAAWGAALTAICGASAAQTGEWSGDVLVAWRNVSVSGAEAKYRQHVNLDDGGRLFGLRLDYRAEQSADFAPDHLSIRAEHLGGDPFENAHLTLRKYGRYTFRYDRRKSSYFYDDLLIAPADVDVERSIRGDLHRFDLEREHDSTGLEVQFSPRASGNLSFDRITRRGDSTTTRDIQRDEFDVEQSIDEVDQVVNLGFQYRWDAVVLTLNERFREYDNRNALLLAGFSEGASPTDPTTLDFYFFDQPYGYDSIETELTLTGRAGNRLDWRFDAMNIDLDLDSDARENVQGVDFLGAPFAGETTGSGDVDREVQLYGLSVDYAYSDRIHLNAALRHTSLDQSGLADFGAETNQYDWDVETFGAELGVEMAVLERTTIGVGWSTERRDVDRFSPTSPDLDTGDTDRDGFFATLDYRASERLTVGATVESNRIDDPFTLASPTDVLRYRLRARMRLGEHVRLNATHTLRDFDNDNSDWSHRREHTDLRLTYDSGQLRFALGSSFVDIARDYRRLVTGGGRQDLFEVDYRGDTRLLDGLVEYRFENALSVGGSYQSYRNKGSVAVDHRQAAVFLRYRLPQNYRLEASYRNLDYDEDLEDYDADIVELAIGVDW